MLTKVPFRLNKELVRLIGVLLSLPRKQADYESQYSLLALRLTANYQGQLLSEVELF